MIHKLNNDLEFLMLCFKEVLEELNEKETAQILPWVNENININFKKIPSRAAQAYSIAFELLDMAEENTATQIRRKIETEKDICENMGLWGYYLKKCSEKNISAQKIANQMKKSKIEIILTAHPTEVKRLPILEHYRELYVLLVEMENKMWTSYERANMREKIKSVLEQIWRTGEIFYKKPDVMSELKNIIHYLKNVFPYAVGRHDNRLKQAWLTMNFDIKLISHPNQLPKIIFGNWVGGDRDGHPFVTADITGKTLLKLRHISLELIEKTLKNLYRKLSLSDSLQKIPDQLKKRIAVLSNNHKDKAETIAQKNHLESFRQFLELMIVSLPSKDILEKSKNDFFYKSHYELLSDLQILYDSLTQIGGKRLACQEVFTAMRVVYCFGFHLSALDIRQNSGFHDKALSQIFSFSKTRTKEYGQLTFEQKMRILNEKLKHPPSYSSKKIYTKKETKETLDCYKKIKEYVDKNGYYGIGYFIVSMTRDAADLLAIYVFAHEAGLLQTDKSKPYLLIPVVPLFETIEDLINSPKILDDFLSNPIVKFSIEKQKNFNKQDIKRVPVMIGYSDSTKDGGILTGHWNLHIAMLKMLETGKKHKVKIDFFHGKGGTISRGAGPTHRFIEAQISNSIDGFIRITEQGESISQKYANFANAVYNIELLSAGVIGASLIKNQNLSAEKKEMGDILSKYSFESYKNLINSSGFIEYYNEATPIDAIGQLNIGSRPSRRTGKQSIEDLRAIPWVFSFSQNRCFLTGWYGTGTALYKLKTLHPEKYNKLKNMILGVKEKWSFMEYTLINIETSISSADMKIMKEYAKLVSDKNIQQKFNNLISDEYFLTLKMLRDISEKSIQEKRPSLAAAIERREKPLKLLHQEQIFLLKKWRKLKKNKSLSLKEENEILSKLILSVNAIASGLRTTG
ncbi:MAG: phosphoenolpyruvate carboxylase [Spirochaetia bacterium]|nr:phosphoenolpyruvate carboxylase [Spirochaetia bacterium]